MYYFSDIVAIIVHGSGIKFVKVFWFSSCFVTLCKEGDTVFCGMLVVSKDAECLTLFLF